MNSNDSKNPLRGSRPDTDLFAGLGPPAVPLGLRQRVLTRARSQASESWIDRLWESPTLRWGWLVSVVLLLVLQTRLASTMPETMGPATARTAPAPSPPTSGLEGDHDLGMWLARHPVREPAGLLLWVPDSNGTRIDQQL